MPKRLQRRAAIQPIGWPQLVVTSRVGAFSEHRC
jgi:hypothetical protein